MDNIENKSTKSSINFNIDAKILVVDDCQENLYALEKVLAPLGAKIVLAKSGQEALSHIVREEFALIILDVQMPEMDGYETASHIIAYNESKNIPIIFLTAFNKETTDIHKAYEHGAVDYMFKPFDSKILKSKAKAFVEIYKQKKSIENILSNLKNMQFCAENILNTEDEHVNKVLVVDDINENLIAIKTILKPIGIQVDTALSGRQALDLAANNNYATIILDVQMPEMDGFEVANKVREIKLHKNTPIIFVTAISKEDKYIFKGYQSGAIDYLFKPVEADVLRYKVKFFLKLYEQNITLERLLFEKEKLLEKIQIQNNQLRQLSHRDILTGMPNRSYFEIILKRKIFDANKENRKLAIVSLSIKNFSQINSKKGFKISDNLLVEFSNRVKKMLSSDSVASRYSEEQFMLIIDNITDDEDISQKCEKIVKDLSDYYYVNGEKYYIEVFTGVSVFPNSGTTSETLIQNSNIALNSSKQSPESINIFSENLNVDYEKNVKIEALLRYAVSNKEFKINYQPRYNLKTKKLVGLEALLRWGEGEPQEFLPIAEETGLINEVGYWAFRQICVDMIDLQSRLSSDIKISINIAVTQLNTPDFIDNIQRILFETKVNPKFLEVEIPESSIMDTSNLFIDSNINKLKELGIGITIDNIGTTALSLCKLKSLPVSSIKIDKKIIGRINQVTKSDSMVKAIIDIAKDYELNVIAVGIENDIQLDFLQQIECNEGQGFLFVKPLPKEDFGSDSLEVAV